MSRRIARSPNVLNRKCLKDFWTIHSRVRKLSRKINFSQGQGKVGQFHFESGKIEVLERSQGKWIFKSTFVYILRTWSCFIGTICSWNWTTSWCWVSKKSIIFARYVEELLIHVYCIWLAESINKWLEGIRLWGGRGVESIIRTDLRNC